MAAIAGAVVPALAPGDGRRLSPSTVTRFVDLLHQPECRGSPPVELRCQTSWYNREITNVMSDRALNVPNVMLQ